MTKGRTSAPLSETKWILGKKEDQGAEIEFLQNWKIYIAKTQKLWKGSLVRGSLALCKVLKLIWVLKFMALLQLVHSKVGGK